MRMALLTTFISLGRVYFFTDEGCTYPPKTAHSGTNALNRPDTDHTNLKIPGEGSRLSFSDVFLSTAECVCPIPRLS